MAPIAREFSSGIRYRMEEKKVCTFKNSTLYESHLQLLNHGNWLNDEIIQFYYEYLEDECAKLSKTVALVHPSSVEMCKFMSGLFLKVRQELFADVVGAELKECLESLNLADAHYVFIPVNDNEDATSVGGTHWSLLVWSKSAGTFFSLDSLGNHNNKQGENFFDFLLINFEAGLRIASKFFPLCCSSTGIKLNITSISVPRQPNSFDCGVYVLAFTQLIIKNLETSKQFHQYDYSSVTPEYIQSLRREIREKILSIGITY